jgi:hypothetical protein
MSRKREDSKSKVEIKKTSLDFAVLLEGLKILSEPLERLSIKNLAVSNPIFLLSVERSNIKAACINGSEAIEVSLGLLIKLIY